MTTTVTGLVSSSLSQHSYDFLSTHIGLAVIILLAFVLLLRELVLIVRDGDASFQLRGLDVAVLPLLIVFAIVVLARLADLLL